MVPYLEQLKSIQALRAFAALAVMFAHMHGIELRQSGESVILSNAWISGVSGVDLFFVISGFIMVWVAGDETQGVQNASKFLFARAMRIFPLWWLFAAAMSAYFLVAYGAPWDAEMLARLGVGGPEHLLKSFLLIPHNAFPVLVLGWTLMHEIYFYIVFGLLLLLPQGYRIPACIIWGLIVTAGISAQITGFYANTLLSLALFPMTLEFLMGAAAAWAIKAGHTHFRWPALLLGGLWLTTAILMVDFTRTDQFLPTIRTLAFGPAFALIVYGIASIEKRSQLGRSIPRPLVALGDWSYSIYLCHLLVISAVARVYFSIIPNAGVLANLGFLVLSLLSVIIVSGLTYALFEKRVLKLSRRLRRTWFKPQSSTQAP